MGNEIKEVIFGGAKIFNPAKTEVKYDKKNTPTYCVWMENGTYFEYPEQDGKPVTSYFAKSDIVNDFYQIPEKTYKSGKTTRDYITYEFEKFTESHPSIMVVDYNIEGENVQKTLINGFKGVNVTGSASEDRITFTTSSNIKVTVDNDNAKDIVTYDVDCKKFKTKAQKDVDKVYRYSGFAKSTGFGPEYK